MVIEHINVHTWSLNKHSKVYHLSTSTHPPKNTAILVIFNNLEDSGEEIITVKGCGLDLTGSEYKPGVKLCEHSNEPSPSIQGAGFLA
jgi:hypothetical protein